MSESTRTAIFGIFVTAARKLTAAQVIALAKPLRISATNVKSHLTRMVAEGALQRKGPARLAVYWPSERQATVVEGIATRLNTAPAEAWNGGWISLAPQL